MATHRSRPIRLLPRLRGHWRWRRYIWVFAVLGTCIMQIRGRREGLMAKLGGNSCSVSSNQECGVCFGELYRRPQALLVHYDPSSRRLHQGCQHIAHVDCVRFLLPNHPREGRSNHSKHRVLRTPPPGLKHGHCPKCGAGFSDLLILPNPVLELSLFLHSLNLEKRDSLELKAVSDAIKASVKVNHEVLDAALYQAAGLGDIRRKKRSSTQIHAIKLPISLLSKSLPTILRAAQAVVSDSKPAPPPEFSKDFSEKFPEFSEKFPEILVRTLTSWNPKGVPRSEAIRLIVRALEATGAPVHFLWKSRREVSLYFSNHTSIRPHLALEASARLKFAEMYSRKPHPSPPPSPSPHLPSTKTIPPDPKISEPKGSEPKSEESKASETKEPKVSETKEPKASEAKEPKASEAKEPKASEAKEPRGSEPKGTIPPHTSTGTTAPEPKAPELKASKPKTPEPNASVFKALESKASESRISEHKRVSTPHHRSSRTTIPEPRASEPKDSEPKASESEASKPKSSEPSRAQPRVAGRIRSNILAFANSSLTFPVTILTHASHNMQRISKRLANVTLCYAGPRSKRVKSNGNVTRKNNAGLPLPSISVFPVKALKFSLQHLPKLAYYATPHPRAPPFPLLSLSTRMSTWFLGTLVGGGTRVLRSGTRVLRGGTRALWNASGDAPVSQIASQISPNKTHISPNKAQISPNKAQISPNEAQISPNKTLLGTKDG